MVERIEPRVTPPVAGPPKLSRVQRSGDRNRRRQQPEREVDGASEKADDEQSPRKGRNIDERC